MSEPTPHFGYTVVGEGEDISKDGYKALGADRATLDNQLYALFTRSFNGDPALGDPTDAPELILLPDGGSLPASTTFYYRTSNIDQYGLETASSDEASVSTPDPIDAPTAPAVATSSTGGTVVAGTYNYVITQVDANGGETTVSPLATIQVQSIDGNSSIELVMPDLHPLAVKFRVYRSRPGQASLYFLAETDTDYTDTGLGEDQTVLAPSVNSTSATNAVQVTIPGAFIPEQAVAWRIYRTTTSGDYSDSSLVHEVVEPASANSPIPTIVHIDTGDGLLVGTPREVSATAPQGPPLDVTQLTGSLPIGVIPRGVRCMTTFGAGEVTDARVLNVTSSPSDIQAVRLTAFFDTPPTGDTTIRFTDEEGTALELPCDAASHRLSDPPGLWRKEFPRLLAAQFDAEDGLRSSTDVQIDPDEAAYSGQAVTLELNGQWVQTSLGELDPGDFATFVKARVLTFDSGVPANDLVLSVRRADDDTVLASVNIQLASSNPSDPTSVPDDFLYQELTGPTFTAPGGVELVLRATKGPSLSETYNIDFMRYTTDVALLKAGLITVDALVAGGSNGSDVNLALWF